MTNYEGRRNDETVRGTSRVETYTRFRLRGRRGRRIEDLHQLLKDLNNGDLVRVQSGGELFLERSQFLRKLTRAEQRFAHLDEGADDPFDSAQGRLPRSSERRADCEEHLQPEVRVLSKGPRAVGRTAATLGTHRNLR